MTKKKKSLREEYKELLPIDNQDYTDAKKYYEEYLEIFDGIIKCENEKDLGKWKIPIIENNPWKEALEKESNKYRSIADSDRRILEPLIEKEIKNFKNEIINKDLIKIFNVNNIVNIIAKVSDCKEKEKIESIIDKEMGTKFYEAIFKDFEHAFDGNFENPKVIILGINPRLKKIPHNDFGLGNVYKNIFDYKYPSYVSNKNHEIYKYYFKNGGFFFESLKKDQDIKNDEDKKNNEIKIKLREKFMDSLKKECPYALYEFFPYATDSEKEWYRGIAIKNVKEYLDVEKILPSQIWMLCLLTYAIKKAIFSGRKMYIFLTKNNKTFRDNFFNNYLNLVKIQEHTNIIVLTKNNNQNRDFRWNNIKDYNKKKMPFESVEGISNIEDFFEKIWGIPRTNEEESEEKD